MIFSRLRWPKLSKWWSQGLALILSFAFALLSATCSPATSQKPTEILWDTYGVPHIYSNDTQGLFRAFGWAQMQSHGNLLLRLYGQARGRAAEYWGQDELESDRWVRLMGIPERAQTWYEAQDAEFRSNLDAFAAGINAYAQQHADLIDDSVEVVLPVTGADVLAHGQRVLHFTFVADPESVAKLVNQERAVGSNAWAIAPSHSESGNAMLLANPHLPWFDLYLWYEAHLNAPNFNAYGATLVGIPALAIAFNDYLGWTHTVNTHDGWDAYELTLAEEGYRWDEGLKAFETEEQILKVKQADGSLKDEPFTIRRSIHGPIISEKDGKAIALRVVGLDQPGALKQWWEMGRAKNLSEFEAALKPVQIPMFTVMYADREGHIMHLFNGQVPVRSQGDFKYWAGVIPGDTSETLWTATHPYEDLPRVVDPPSGWLQNANDPPWSTTFPRAISSSDYPAYMAPAGRMGFRAQRSAKMLMQDPKVSFQELSRYKHSTEVELADRLLDDLIPAARRYGNPLARQAADVLARWDRKTEANSRGAVLFALWAEEVDFAQLFATPWNPDSPMTTPDGLANPAQAVAALETAASKVQSAYKSLDIAWGEVFRLKIDGVELPANGAADPLGVFRSLWARPDDTGHFTAMGGDSYVALIEFSNPVKAMVLTGYGNATQPNADSAQTQLKLFAQKQLRPAWRSRREIEAHLASRQTL